MYTCIEISHGIWYMNTIAMCYLNLKKNFLNEVWIGFYEYSNNINREPLALKCATYEN